MVERWIERGGKKSFEIDRSRRNIALTTGCPRFRWLLRRMLSSSRSIEKLNRIAQRFRCQMRVAKCHSQRRMAEQILDSLHGCAFGRELRCERMSKRVPADWLDVRPFTGSLEKTERRPVDETITVTVKDDIGIAIKRLEFFDHIIRERHVSDSSILRSSDVTADICAADHDGSSPEVHVLPFERREFRESHARTSGREDEDAFHVVRARLDDFCDFMFLEKTKRWRRGFELAKARDGFDDLPFDSCRQTLTKNRETIVDRLVAVATLQLLAFIRLNVRRRDFVEFLMAEERHETRGQDVFL